MITNLDLRNFKSFRHLTLPLKGLTLLTGMNGAGKSSVIQSMCLLRQTFLAGLLDRNGLLLNGELVQLGVGRDVLSERADSETISMGIMDDGALLSWTFSYDMLGDILPAVSAAKGSAVNCPLFGDNFQYLRADRIGPASIYEKSYNSVFTRRSLGARGEFVAHFLAVHQTEPVDAARRHHDSEVTGGLLSQVIAWMQDFSPGVRLEVFDIDNTDLVRLAFQYGGSAGLDSSNFYRPTNVGFGLTYTLPVVVACLSAPKGGLVLLENPEAHLHPQGQLAMGRLIAKAAASGLQIIVETHSDHLLNGVRLAVKRGELDAGLVATHFFSHADHAQDVSIESPSMTDSGRLSAWPKGFFDQWESSLDELLS